MKVSVAHSEVKGCVSPPGGKSEAQRIIAAAALCIGKTTVLNCPNNADTIAALRCAESLGCTVGFSSDALSIEGNPGELRTPLSEVTVLDCGESGLAARIFTNVAALYPKQITITGRDSLLGRPFHSFHSIFHSLDVAFSSQSGNLPLMVKGPLISKDVVVDGSISSQFVSGLKIALSSKSERRQILIEQLTSLPYVHLTMNILRDFGVNWSNHSGGIFVKEEGFLMPTRISVAADWSSASALLVAGALCSNEKLELLGLDMNSGHADRAILQILQIAGIRTELRGNLLCVFRGAPQAFDFDFSDCPDLVPVAMTLAASSKGRCKFWGTSRLRFKESDRAQTMKMELERAGVSVEVYDNHMVINPHLCNSANFFSHGDHRVAMAMTIFALANHGGTIFGADTVSKSYPNFFNDLISIGAHLTMD